MTIARIEDKKQVENRGNKYTPAITAALPVVELNAETIEGSAKELQIVPLGHKYRLHYWDGDSERYVDRIIELSREWLEEVIANTREYRLGQDMPVKIDHFPTGEAYGWWNVEDLRFTEAHLVATMPDWTEDTREMIKQKKFKYVSVGIPMTGFNTVNAGQLGPHFKELSLTNDPFFMGMNAVTANNEGNIVVAAQQITDSEEDTMDRKKLAKSLGLPEDASDEQIEAKLDELKGSDEALSELRTNYNVAEGEEFPSNLVAPEPETEPAKEAETEPAKEPEEVKASGMGKDQATLLCSGFVEAGRIAPDKKATFVGLFASMTTAQAQAVIAELPKVVPDPAGIKASAKQEDDDAPTVDASILEACGVSAESVKKYGK